MSERFTMRVPATYFGEWTVIAEGALDGQIGQPITIHREAGGDIVGTLRTARVMKDGSAVDLDIEAPDGTLPWPSLSGVSLAR